MDLQCPATPLLVAALLEQTWVEVWDKPFNHFPDLKGNVAFPPSFKGIQAEFFEGLAIITAESSYFAQKGLLDFLESLNLPFCDWCPKNRGVFEDGSDQAFVQGQHGGSVPCLEGPQDPGRHVFGGFNNVIYVGFEGAIR